MSIVIEEADALLIWLEFIIDENMIKKDLIYPLFKEADELAAIFIASRRTARKGKNDPGQMSPE